MHVAVLQVPPYSCPGTIVDRAGLGRLTVRVHPLVLGDLVIEAVDVVGVVTDVEVAAVLVAVEPRHLGGLVAVHAVLLGPSWVVGVASREARRARMRSSSTRNGGPVGV